MASERYPAINIQNPYEYGNRYSDELKNTKENLKRKKESKMRLIARYYIHEFSINFHIWNIS